MSALTMNVEFGAKIPVDRAHKEVPLGDGIKEIAVVEAAVAPAKEIKMEKTASLPAVEPGFNLRAVVIKIAVHGLREMSINGIPKYSKHQWCGEFCFYCSILA